MGYTRKCRMRRVVGQKSKRQQSSTFNSRSRRRKRQKQKILRRSLKGGVKKRKKWKKRGSRESTLYRGNKPTSPRVLAEQEKNFTKYLQSLKNEKNVNILDPSARVFVPKGKANPITTDWTELLKRLDEEDNKFARNHVFEESKSTGICKCGKLRRNHT
jgi:hypothetical protein